MMEEKLERLVELAMSIGYEDCSLQMIGETDAGYDQWVQELESIKADLISELNKGKLDKYNYLCA